MENDFIFKIIDLFHINGNHVVTGELENEIIVECPIIVISENMTARGVIKKIEIFNEDERLSVDRADPLQPVGLYIELPEGFPIKKECTYTKRMIKSKDFIFKRSDRDQKI